MNRSILIVICDFLLVSLLAFSTVDINKVSDEGTARMAPTSMMVTNQAPDAGKDLANVMRLALDEERKNRDLLMGELARSREALSRQQTLLGEREEQVRTFQQQLSSSEAEAGRLQSQRTALEQQYTSAQTNLEELNRQLSTVTGEATTSKERAALIEAELRKQSEQAAELQKRLSSLEQSNRVVLEEKQRLSTQLQVAEVEKRSAAELANRMEQQAKIEREERARIATHAEKLAEDVKTLASTSGELAHEIRENRPIAPNLIFADVAANRVEARLTAVRTGAFGGDASRARQTQTVLATDGTNTFAICHLDDTPLGLGNPGVNWESFSGNFLGPSTRYAPIHALYFHARDPRVVLFPIPEADQKALGAKSYRSAAEPYKFENALLVGAREGYYGECRFRVDLNTPGYVQLDRSFIRGLFGKFNPSSGDLVFSKSGELLGVMVNNNYCMMLSDFSTSGGFTLGPDVRGQQTGRTLAALHTIVGSLPQRLQ
jgi:hypothetical protein